jgi:hypothetical protein
VAVAPRRGALYLLELSPQCQQRGGNSAAHLIEFTLARGENLLEPLDIGAQAGNASPQSLKLFDVRASVSIRSGAPGIYARIIRGFASRWENRCLSNQRRGMFSRVRLSRSPLIRPPYLPLNAAPP